MTREQKQKQKAEIKKFKRSDPPQPIAIEIKIPAKFRRQHGSSLLAIAENIDNDVMFYEDSCTEYKESIEEMNSAAIEAARKWKKLENLRVGILHRVSVMMGLLSELDIAAKRQKKTEKSAKTKAQNIERAVRKDRLNSSLGADNRLDVVREA